MEVNRHGLHYGLSNFGWIRHSSSSHRPPDQNESFHTLQQKSGCTAVRNIVLQRSHMTARHTQRRHHRQGKPIHLGLVEENHGETWNRKKAKHGIPPTNGWTNRTNQWDTRTVSTSIRQLLAGQLERTITHGRICLQQQLSRNY